VSQLSESECELGCSCTCHVCQGCIGYIPLTSLFSSSYEVEREEEKDWQDPGQVGTARRSLVPLPGRKILHPGPGQRGVAAATASQRGAPATTASQRGAATTTAGRGGATTTTTTTSGDRRYAGTTSSYPTTSGTDTVRAVGCEGTSVTTTPISNGPLLGNRGGSKYEEGYGKV